MLHFEDFKEGQKVLFTANVTVAGLTKDKVYKGKIVKDKLYNELVITFVDDDGRHQNMSYEYADSKIDILEEV